MTKEQIMQVLYAYCLSNNTLCLKRLLLEYVESVDLLYEEGNALKIAVARRPEILETLLEFYEETQLQNSDKFQNDIAYKKLQYALKNAHEEGLASDAVEAILKQYISLEEDVDVDDNEQDLSVFEYVDLVDQSHRILRKSHSESNLIQHKQVASKLLLHSSSESLLSELDSSGGADVHETTNLGQGSELFQEL